MRFRNPAPALLSAAAVCVIVSACAAVPSQQHESDGISASEASQNAVLHGEFDARLVVLNREQGRYTLELTNLGSRPDTYSIVVAPQATTDTAKVALAPGESTRITVRGDAGGQVDVISVGLGGRVASVNL